MEKLIRVLVVEDSPIAQLTAKNHLTQMNCLVDTAADEESALAKANSVSYDIILMDLGLYPSRDGFQVAKQIKTVSILNKETPIIALSIHDEAQFYQQLQEAGIEGFIAKPFCQFEAKELVDFIRETNKHL